MSNVVLTLGGVPFRDFEVPEKISLGGSQRLAVQPLIGGGRVVDVLGYDDGEINFAGVFSGADAGRRAQLLDGLRVTGATIPLAWDRFFYNVVIVQFAAEYKKPWWIGYALRCVVVMDPVAELANLAVTATSLIVGDIATATGFGMQAGISLGALTADAPSIEAAQAALNHGIGLSGGALLSGAGMLTVAADAGAGITAMNQISASAGELAAAGFASGYLNRAAANFAAQLP